MEGKMDNYIYDEPTAFELALQKKMERKEKLALRNKKQVKRLLEKVNRGMRSRHGRHLYELENFRKW